MLHLPPVISSDQGNFLESFAMQASGLCIEDPSFEPGGLTWAHHYNVKNRFLNPHNGARIVDEESQPVSKLVNVASGLGIHESDVVLLSGPPLLASVDASKPELRVGGLLYGVFEAWRRHKGVAISPAILWFTITVQVADAIKANPLLYQSLFTRSGPAKQTISIITPEITPEAFVSALRDRVSNKDLVSLVVDVDDLLPSAPSDGVPFSEVMCAVFLEMASPYYEYEGCECGLRNILLLGGVAEWASLLKKCTELAALLPHVDHTISESPPSVTGLFLTKAIERVRVLSAR